MLKKSLNLDQRGWSPIQRSSQKSVEQSSLTRNSAPMAKIGLSSWMEFQKGDPLLVAAKKLPVGAYLALRRSAQSPISLWDNFQIHLHISATFISLEFTTPNPPGTWAGTQPSISRGD